jgi:hypothetical protein
MRCCLPLVLFVSCGSDEEDGGAARRDAGSGGSIADGSWLDTSADANPDAQPLDGSIKPPPGNALHLADGSVHALAPVSDPLATTRAVAFARGATLVKALDEDGNPLWEKDLGAGAMFGGFDFDADGWPDLGLVRAEPAGGTCGTTPLENTRLDVVRGKDGELFALTPATAAKCWTFPTATYPTNQWTTAGISFGASATLVLTQYYATDGSFRTFGSGSFEGLGTFFYPSTASYDSAYTSDLPNAWGTGTSYLENSHVANGLVVEPSVTLGERFVMFTSGRLVEYAVTPLAAGQLLVDKPFVTGNRTDLAGRNYGLVARDPAHPSTLVLLAGTSVETLYEDMSNASMTSDPWGGIERHMTVYDLETRTLEDRFFSYAHDNGDANQYEGRLLAPPGPFVRLGTGTPSRLAFNVYSGGHWILHVTAPGSTSDAVTFKDLFLWDISDLDQDGTDEWLLSPSRDPEEPDVPGYYFVKWRTRLAHWDEASLSLTTQVEHQGVIPWLSPALRRPDRTTSRGSLYPALSVRRESGLVLLLRDAAGSVVEEPL